MKKKQQTDKYMFLFYTCAITMVFLLGLGAGFLITQMSISQLFDSGSLELCYTVNKTQQTYLDPLIIQFNLS
jgi:hypothetical protein